MARVKIGKMIVDKIKKDKLGGEVFSPSYLTGIDLLDYRNGRWVGYEKVLGIAGGKILTVVGKSGSGKSTLAYKIAGNILKTDEDAQIVHLDFERASNKSRIATMAGIKPSDISSDSELYSLLISGISTESLYNLVKAIHELKLENKDDFTITKTFNGQEVSYLVPTVIIVDSIATMMPNNIIDEDELSGSMSASGIAKTNNAVYKRISNFITDANITVININHITTKIEIGPVKTKPALNFLSQDESLPGGTSSIFLADSLIKLEPGSKLEEDKDFGIKGFTVKARYIKSRSNASGRDMTLVFDQEKGFDNLLTNVQYLKEAKLLLGSGHGYYIEPAPTKKFKMKNVRELYANDAEFREIFDNYIHSIYEAFLTGEDENQVADEEFTLVECIDESKNIWKGNDGKNYIYNEETGDCVECE